MTVTSIPVTGADDCATGAPAGTGGAATGLPPSSANAASSSWRNSPTVLYRWLGSLAMALRMASSTVRGITRPLARVLGVGGGLVMCCERIPMNDSALKGSVPVTSSKRMTPME